MSEIVKFNDIDSFYSDKIGICIRSQEELSENEKKLIEQSELDKLATIEAWTALGTNMQLAYATHGIFRYFGKFPPPIATYLINKYTKKNELVIDPMSGSGTTAVESALLRRRCIVNDLNPLSYLLAKVKTHYIDEARLLDKLEYIKKHYRPLDLQKYNFVPVALKDPDHWFLPDTANSLRGIKYLIEQEKNEEVHDFLNVIFAATVRRVSKATTQQGRLFLDVETAMPDALSTFIKRYKIGAQGLNFIPHKTDISCLNEDLKVLPTLINSERAKLLILHPPYFNSYKYSSINSLETGWLGINKNQYSKQEVKEFFKVGKPENATRYVDDMEVMLKNALSMLDVDGVLAMMIGDTIMKGKYIPVTKMLLDRVKTKKYKVETVAIRVPKYTEATWVASQRRDSNNIGITLHDFIIVIRRKSK